MQEQHTQGLHRFLAQAERGDCAYWAFSRLEEKNIPFDFIVGSSMGAMEGGIKAAGADINMLDRMIEHMDTSRAFDFICRVWNHWPAKE
jgi:NTE family protein